MTLQQPLETGGVMKNAHLLAELLLKQDGLNPGEASNVVLGQIRYLQNRAERRERFWLRLACFFWITVGMCLLAHTLIHAGEAYFSRLDVSNVDHSLLPLETVALLGGIFSSIRLMLVQRQASQETMQVTMAVLTQEIRELKRQQDKNPEKPV
jgi:hypothetical protein